MICDILEAGDVSRRLQARILQPWLVVHRLAPQCETQACDTVPQARAPSSSGTDDQRRVWQTERTLYRQAAERLSCIAGSAACQKSTRDIQRDLKSSMSGDTQTVKQLRISKQEYFSGMTSSTDTGVDGTASSNPYSKLPCHARAMHATAGLR